MPPINPLELLLQGGARELPSGRRPRLMPDRQSSPAIPGLMTGLSEDVNAPADLYNLQNALADETFNRGLMAERAGQPTDANSLFRQFDKLRGDVAASPITAQQTETDAYMQQQRGALSEGFGGSDVDPIRARNLYRRQMEQEKMRQPIQQQELESQGRIKEQEIQSGAMKDVANINAKAATDREANYRELMDMMRAGGTDISRVQMPGRYGGGGFSVHAPQRQPNQMPLMQDMEAVRRNLAAKSLPAVMVPNNPTQEQADYNSVAGNLISMANLPPRVKQDVVEFMQDPISATSPLTELFYAPDDPTAPPEARMSPEMWNELVNLFMKLRGGA